VDIYNNMKKDTNIIADKNFKEWLYYYREWIAEYKNKIFTFSTVELEIGNITDSPKILPKNIV
jgi:hypothetical protein